MLSHFKEASLPAKILTALAFCVLLGIGLCGAAAAVHGNGVQQFLFVAGATFFWLGLAFLVVFGFCWAVVAIGQKLFGNKE